MCIDRIIQRCSGMENKMKMYNKQTNKYIQYFLATEIIDLEKKKEILIETTFKVCHNGNSLLIDMCDIFMTSCNNNK